MINNNTITAKRVKQNNQEFLVSVFTIQQILSFTRYTVRIIDYFENNRPVYNKYVQRKIENSRVEKIAYFLIDDPDAIFPTNIVLSIPNEAIESIENKQNDQVEVVLSDKVFTEIQKAGGDDYITIIDGQHRIKGIERAIEMLKSEISANSKIFLTSNKEEYSEKIKKKTKQLEKLLNINLVVTFFIDPLLEFQAMIFATINRTQKTVPQSLVTSLFGLTEKDTPYKTALEITLALNGFESSPFFNRIKLHGGTYERNQSPPLTQSAMVKSIVDLISTNSKELERDRFRDRAELQNQFTPELPFRKYYAFNRDEFITDILFSFFKSVKNNFKKENIFFWSFEENTKPTNVLHTTVGYHALLQLLIEILKIEVNDDRRDKIETYDIYLKKCSSLNFEDQQRYPFTSITRTIFFLDMSILIWPPKHGNDERYERLNIALKKRY